MVKFTKDHKEEMNNVDYFKEGIHPVKVLLVGLGKTSNDKEYIEFTVVGSGSEEAKVKLWLSTDGAIKYTFNIIRGIFVHNASTDAKKEEIRKKVDAIEDDEALEKACQMLIGKDCWLQVSRSDRTYINKAGETKNSYDNDLYGYEPKPKTPSAVTVDEPVNLNSATAEQIVADF